MRQVPVALLVFLVLFPSPVHGQSSVGVSVGDYATYTLQGDLTEGAVRSRIEVRGISATNVTVLTTDFYSNGTQYEETVWLDVVSGQTIVPNFFFLITPELPIGQQIFTSNAMTVERRDSLTCAGVVRQVNVGSNTNGTQIGTTYYWDREKGIYCELLSTYLNSTGGASVGVHAVMEETNLWSPPSIMPPSTLSDSLIVYSIIGGIGALLLVAVLVFRRVRKH